VLVLAVQVAELEMELRQAAAEKAESEGHARRELATERQRRQAEAGTNRWAAPWQDPGRCFH